MTDNKPERKIVMPKEMAAPYTREEAEKCVAMLQEKFDLVDQNVVLRDLIEKMEERHGEQFNAFFERVIAAFLKAASLKSVTINASDVLRDMADAPDLDVGEDRFGGITYSLKGAADENE